MGIGQHDQACSSCDERYKELQINDLIHELKVVPMITFTKVPRVDSDLKYLDV